VRRVEQFVVQSSVPVIHLEFKLANNNIIFSNKTYILPTKFSKCNIKGSVVIKGDVRFKGQESCVPIARENVTLSYIINHYVKCGPLFFTFL
jgi:hypothetical protein